MHPDGEVLFFSDCHLDATKPEIQHNLNFFLTTRACQAQIIYILGDLFEVWLGDDDPSIEHTDTLQNLNKLSEKGIEIFFIAGNRDFLVGNQLAERTGFTILDEPILISLGNEKVLLMHGDTLCTDDIDYQKFRLMVREKQWQHWFTDKPLEERQQIAAQLRADSHKAMKTKSTSIMDVNASAVMECFETRHIDVLIHGHTHRPGIHQIESNRKRIVLGDWNPEASYLSWKPDAGFNLVDARI